MSELWGGGRGRWGKGREIFIKIEHRLPRSGLDLTLASLLRPLSHSSVVGLHSFGEGGLEKHAPLGRRPWRVSLKLTLLKSLRFCVFPHLSPVSVSWISLKSRRWRQWVFPGTQRGNCVVLRMGGEGARAVWTHSPGLPDTGPGCQ